MKFKGVNGRTKQLPLASGPGSYAEIDRAVTVMLKQPLTTRAGHAVHVRALKGRTEQVSA